MKTRKYLASTIILALACMMAGLGAIISSDDARATQTWYMMHHEAQGNHDESWTKCMPESAWNGHKNHDGDWIGDVCSEPTEEPTEEPTLEPTEEPTEEPTLEPTEEPTLEPTEEPTGEPTDTPTGTPPPPGGYVPPVKRTHWGLNGCWEFRVIALVQANDDGTADLLRVKKNGDVILNLTASLSGVASDPDIDACKIVLAFQVTDEANSDIYLSGVNGQIKQITDTPDASEVTPVFYKGDIVYVVNGELHQMNLDGSNDQVIGQGTNPASSNKGNLSYTGTNGNLVIDGQDTGVAGTSVNWVPNGLLYLGTDGDLYLLNPDLSSTHVGGTDMAPDPVSKKLNGLVSVSGSGDVWYFDPSESVVTGFDQDWWSIFGTKTGW